MGKLVENYTKMPYDKVIKPEHYANKEIEPIEYIKSTLSPIEFIGHCWGNVLKYVSRWQDKNGTEDLEKAKVYLNWLEEAANELNGTSKL